MSENDETNANDDVVNIEHADSEDRGSGPSVRLPRRRHVSPWKSPRLLLASFVGLLLLVPLWIDPLTLDELRNVTPLPNAEASRTPAVTARPASNGATPPPGAAFAQDSFDREVANGWGTADLGGTYSSETRDFAALSVESGAALVLAGVESSGWAALGDESTRDVDVTVQVTLSHEGAGTVSAGPTVRTSDGGMYSVRLVTSGETAALVVDLVQASSELDARLRGPVTMPVDMAGGEPVMVRLQATGSDPTFIRARAWLAGRPEPAQWPVQVVDWTGRLQQPAGIGLSWKVAGLPTGGTDIKFDNLLALAIDPELVQ